MGMKYKAFEIKIKDDGEIEGLYKGNPLWAMTENYYKSWRYFKPLGDFRPWGNKETAQVIYGGDFREAYGALKDYMNKMESEKEIKTICNCFKNLYDKSHDYETVDDCITYVFKKLSLIDKKSGVSKCQK